MFYSANNIIDTIADAIVVPCAMDEEILPGTTQEEVFNRYGTEYQHELSKDIAGELMDVGAPGVFQKRADTCILSIPVYRKDSTSITEGELLKSIQEVVKFVAHNDGTIRTIAIGAMGWEFPEELVEAMCEMEERKHADEIEFIFYPEQQDYDNDNLTDMEPLIPDVELIRTTTDADDIEDWAGSTMC